MCLQCYEFLTSALSKQPVQMDSSNKGKYYLENTLLNTNLIFSMALNQSTNRFTLIPFNQLGVLKVIYDIYKNGIFNNVFHLISRKTGVLWKRSTKTRDIYGQHNCALECTNFNDVVRLKITRSFTKSTDLLKPQHGVFYDFSVFYWYWPWCFYFSQTWDDLLMP